MNTEELKSKLIAEGFANVYEWKDEPGTRYESHAHKGKVSMFIISGSVTFSGDFEKTLKMGDRFDVPPGTNHSAIVGPEGCGYVVGEEIEGDS